MASPFNVFRKNQKVLMALLVGFSMIAFIVADSINATNFPIFLGAVLGALALWLLSGKGGTEGWLIAAVGAVLGAVVGLYGPSLLGDNTAVYTARGDLSNRDIAEITQRQNKANEFLSLAARAVAEKLPKEQRASYQGPQLFGFPAESHRENAVLTYLFEEEADDLGITLSDAAVGQFIVDVTQGKLTDADLRRIRSSMQVGTGELIDILREEIRAREAFRLLVPRTGPTPQDLWADFRKVSAEAEVTAVAVPAEAFLDQVEEPSEEEVARFFDEYRSVPPGEDGAPGFLVPRQVQVAYLEVDFEDVKKTVPPPTDEEVRAFYERNRAQFDFDPNRAAGGSTPAESPAAGEAPQGGTPAPVEAPRGPQPAGGEAAAPTDGTAAPESSQPPTDSPAETPQPAETPSEDTPATDEAPATEEAPQGEERSSASRDGFEFVSFQEGQNGAEPAASESPATPDAAAPAEGTTPATDPPAFPASTASDPAPPAGPSQATLDAIRRDLLNQRAREAADAKTERVLADMDALVMRVMDAVPLPEDPRDEEQKRKYEEERRAAVKNVVEEMKTYAKKNGLKFRTTPLLSAQELFESEDYPVGKAIRWEKDAPLFGRDMTPVVQMIFQGSPDQPLSPIAAQDSLTESRYIALKINDVPQRPSSLEEEGMRERVVRAWKLREARELARERAEQLAKKADGKDADLAEALKGETVTGKPGGQELTARQVGPFTWLRQSTAPSTMFALPTIVPNELPQLPGAGEEFMRTVFEELKVGETGVAPAEDGSAYYVVELGKRSTEEELAKIREEFLDPLQNPFTGFSPFRFRMFDEAGEVRSKWLEAFRQRNQVFDPAAGQAQPAA